MAERRRGSCHVLACEEEVTALTVSKNSKHTALHHTRFCVDKSIIWDSSELCGCEGTLNGSVVNPTGEPLKMPEILQESSPLFLIYLNRSVLELREADC